MNKHSSKGISLWRILQINNLSSFNKPKILLWRAPSGFIMVKDTCEPNTPYLSHRVDFLIQSLLNHRLMIMPFEIHFCLSHYGNGSRVQNTATFNTQPITGSCGRQRVHQGKYDVHLFVRLLSWCPSAKLSHDDFVYWETTDQWVTRSSRISWQISCEYGDRESSDALNSLRERRRNSFLCIHFPPPPPTPPPLIQDLERM